MGFYFIRYSSLLLFSLILLNILYFFIWLIIASGKSVLVTCIEVKINIKIKKNNNKTQKKKKRAETKRRKKKCLSRHWN